MWWRRRTTIQSRAGQGLEHKALFSIFGVFVVEHQAYLQGLHFPMDRTVDPRPVVQHADIMGQPCMSIVIAVIYIYMAYMAFHGICISISICISIRNVCGYTCVFRAHMCTLYSTVYI